MKKLRFVYFYPVPTNGYLDSSIIFYIEEDGYRTEQACSIADVVSPSLQLMVGFFIQAAANMGWKANRIVLRPTGPDIERALPKVDGNFPVVPFYSMTISQAKVDKQDTHHASDSMTSRDLDPILRQALRTVWSEFEAYLNPA